jgi:hypothetical protein
MPAFDYRASPIPIRDDLPAAYRRAFERLAAAGCWWTGEQRVAIAREVRRASACALCRARREALSASAVEGRHEASGALPAAAVEAVHHLVTDASRITRRWLEGLLADGLSDAHYVELLGVVTTILCIDGFHAALGLPPEPLPEPRAGAPSGYRPAAARIEMAFVPTIPSGEASGSEADLYPLARVPNVVRALSLVPDAVRQLRELSAAQYLPLQQVTDVRAEPAGRALSRAQMELVAGRVSALHECFY